jgi:DegV family protein with EDD domain
MKHFDIYVDSGANIPNELVKERDIHVISFFCTVNGEERKCYEQDIPFEQTAKQFYDDMRAGADVKTSLLPAATFVEAMKPSLKAGKDVLLLTISSGISGTFNQAKEAKAELEKAYPNNKVFVLDSANASMGTGLLALKAADLRDLGESSEAAAQWVEANAYKMNSYLTVGDLNYLRKTGRISTTVAIAGTLLNIKPILRADGSANAKITSFTKAHGRKKAIASLAKIFSETAIDPTNQRISIMHADCEEDALALAELLREQGVRDIIVGYYDLATGSHVGPGTVALFFMGKSRRSALPMPEKTPVANGIPAPAKS